MPARGVGTTVEDVQPTKLDRTVNHVSKYKGRGVIKVLSTSYFLRTRFIYRSTDDLDVQSLPSERLFNRQFLEHRIRTTLV